MNINTMIRIIQATSIIGCSISLMFCLLAVLVLGCYREKTRLLLIKQQQSITLVFINIVMLTGFQGMSSKPLCRAATSLLHYFVLACFSWLTADQYFIFKSVVKTKPHVNFMKLFIAAWGFPVPFLIIQLLVGFLLDQKIGSVLYTCWGSDFVALTLLIPAGGLSVASITMLSITVKSVIKRPAPTTYTRRKTDEAIKYGIKTSSVMIFITVVVWVFAHLLFWYPENIDFQLIFALSSGLQGLFNFFFYCVFALELDIYVSDKLFSETDDVDEFARNTGSVKLSSINRQDIQNMESLRRPQKGNRNRPFFDSSQKLPPMIEEEPLSFHTGKSTPTITRRLSDPLPWYPPGLSGNAKKPLFGNLPPEIAKREKKSQRQNDELNNDEKASTEDVMENEEPYMLDNQVTQRVEEASVDAPVPNSPLMPGPFYNISNSNRDKTELRRSNSVPCAPPKYATGMALPAGVSHRINNDLSPTQELERSLVEGLFQHGEDNKTFLPTKNASKTYELPRKSVPSFKFGSSEQKTSSRQQFETQKGDSESYRDDASFKEKEGMHYLTSGKLCQRNDSDNNDSGNKKIQHETQKTSPPKAAMPKDRDMTSDGYGTILPEDNGNSRSFNRSFDDSPNTFDNYINPPHPGFPSVDVKTAKSVSSTGGTVSASRLRPRPSVPSLKFALNELESLFSNQDLISAADRKLSVQSDSKTINTGPEGRSST